MPKIISIVSILVGLSTLIGAGFALDSRWQQEEDVILLAQNVSDTNNRLSAHIIYDQADEIQKRMWLLKDRYGEDPSKFPDTVKEEYRSLEAKYNQIQKNIDKIIKSQIKIENKEE